MTEAQFQAQIVDLAKMSGWLVHAERPALTGRGWRTPIQGHAGFPDLVMTRGQRLVIAELKVGRNRPTSSQEAWLQALAGIGPMNGHPEVHTWWPEDMPEIIALLTNAHRSVDSPA